jgi:hypothetical protein
MESALDLLDNSAFNGDRPAFYRAKADQCRLAAEEAGFAEIRTRYQELATAWDDLARQAETAPLGVLR